MMSFGVGRRICAGLSIAMLHIDFFVVNMGTGEGVLERSARTRGRSSSGRRLHVEFFVVNMVIGEGVLERGARTRGKLSSGRRVSSPPS
jgi:hypothetical protein